MSYVPADEKLVDVDILEVVSFRSGPGSSDTSLDEVLTFSPDLGLSPVTSLSGNMGHLSCMDSITRRLKLSPDSQNPSPTDSGSHHQVTMETATPTGFPAESTPRSNSQICVTSDSTIGGRICKPKKSTRRAKLRNNEENSIPAGTRKKKKSHLNLTDLFHSPEHVAGHQRQQSEKAKPGQGAKERNVHSGDNRDISESNKLSVSHISPKSKDGDSEDGDLIGDFSKPYRLPVEVGKHQDLKYINCATLAHLLGGGYKEIGQHYHVVDCRYPYEYTGGHIKGALNLYREEHISQSFLKNPALPQSRTLLIFHCEYSSERGPKLCRSLRNLDRNANTYPNLCYPELYLLKGGYKEFYEKFKSLCEPQGYVHMLQRDFRDQFRQYHRKKNPWAARRIRKELFEPLSPNKNVKTATKSLSRDVEKS
ncbi:uncharacterized protein LOC142501862 isoform X2 [Ascaphus truei]|uniref:uncharacterized protein LOC142501862 isoform X2 n=1 Tax=Ascaphus truei TaxID=8439 RepID=UPI003F593707